MGKKAVLWIRIQIRSDPELFPDPEFCVPDPARMKQQMN